MPEDGRAGFSLNGSHAEYLMTLPRNVRVLPPGLSPKAAALAEPVGVALYGARRARVGLGDRVLVLGAGAIGLFAMQVCRAAGAAEVWQADLRPERLELARSLGARGVFDLSKTPLLEVLGSVRPTGAWDVAVALIADGRVKTEALIQPQAGGVEVLRQEIQQLSAGP